MIPKHRTYKLVVGNPHNSDQRLLGFFSGEYSASLALTGVKVGHPNWKEEHKPLTVKHTDPEEIHSPVDTDYAHYNRALIPDDEWKKVMESGSSAEICSHFLTCGGSTYYNLSKMISKEWTVIDIGCGYNAQSYLFQEHARHIGVAPKHGTRNLHCELFKAPNTELYEMSGQDFIKDVLPTLNLDMRAVFAIVNYMPDDDCAELVRKTFKNLWIYYPYTKREYVWKPTE